jgi:hypothetical protein
MSVLEKFRKAEYHRKNRAENGGSAFTPVEQVLLFGILFAGSLNVGIGLAGTDLPGVPGNGVSLSNGSHTYHVDNYTIHLLPESHEEMDGRDGFYRHGEENRFYLNKDASLGRLETACNHEYMHELGMLGERAHDFIYMNHGEVSSPLCSKLVDLIEESRR